MKRTVDEGSFSIVKGISTMPPLHFKHKTMVLPPLSIKKMKTTKHSANIIMAMCVVYPYLELHATSPKTPYALYSG